MLNVVLFFLYLALVVYALVGVVQAEEEDLGGIQKGFWVVAIVFLPLAGSIAWIVVSRGLGRRGQSSRERANGYPAARPSADRYPRRPRSWEQEAAERDAAAVAPEDDPEFLWLMEQAKRKREREQREREQRETGEGTADPRPAGDG